MRSSWLWLAMLVLTGCSYSLPSGCPPDCVGVNLSNRDLSRINLSGANLSGANFAAGQLDRANLSGAELSGATLDQASMQRVNLADARLIGANLLKANLSGATLTGADFSAANLSGATLTGAGLDNIRLVGVRLEKTRLIGVNLSHIELQGAGLTQADLTGANLSGANLTGAVFANANLQGANLEGANMVGADLFQADLTGANFKNALLSGADLSGALLNGADLRGADLRGSQLAGATLNGAALSQANLSQANLENALLHGATLTGSNLADINLTGADLDGLKYDSSTRWPQSFSVAAVQSQRTGIDFSGLKIILFTTGSSSKTDAWVAVGVEGLAALSTLGAETTHALVLPNQLTAMRYYAQQHPDIIIGHGSEYSKVMPLLAKEFPEIKFIQIDGKAGNGTNLTAYQFRYSEAGYVAGTLAGYMSASGKIGGMGGEPAFSAEVAHTALTEAAQQVNPNITQVPLLYTNNWYDLKAAKPVARQLIADNVDVIVAYADGPVLGAADEAGKATSPVYIIGWTKDQQNLAPQLMLTTINQRIDNVLIEAVRSIQAGTMVWGVHVVGFAEGAQELSPFNPLIPQQVRFEVEGVIQAIIDDKITFDDTGKVIVNNYHP